MSKKQKDTKKDLPIIISVGGSLIVPNTIDTNFLSAFKNIIEKNIKKGKRFVIISGGGRTARNYQEAAHRVTPLAEEDMDWLGIHSTRLNGHLLRTIFYKHSHPRMVTDPHEDVIFTEKILVASGWKPGFSTDYCAVLLARNIGARQIINLSNIDYVFDKDPKKHTDAKPLYAVSWEKFRKLIPEKWSPGLSSPFDPVASKLADELGMEVTIMNGKNIDELEKYLSGEEFIGTKIS